MAKQTLSTGSGRTNIHAAARLLPTLSVQDFSSQIKNINPAFSLLPIEQKAKSIIKDKKKERQNLSFLSYNLLMYQ